MATFAKGADVPETDRQRLQERFEGMMRALHKEQGATLRIEIMADKPIQDFIDTHAGILDSSSASVKMSDDMRSRLSRSNWIFSGIKTFHELNEAFPSLINEDGSRKPFERFLNDVQKIDETYNRNYLHSEYNYVHASADMAAKWEQFMEDGDRYLLQYRTAHDDRVRPEHAELEGVTLPIDDSFWADYYPPNGWNCRCTVVQVRRGKYETTPHDEAMTRGEIALQGDKRGNFRFNSGQQRKSVPDYNPYTISQCRNCDIAKGNIKLAFIPSNQLCAACKIVRKCAGDSSKSATAIERKHYLHEMEPLLEFRHTMPTKEEGKAIKVVFRKEGNQHLFADTFGRSRVLQKEDLKGLDALLLNSTPIGDAECHDPKKLAKGYQHFYYYEAELHGQKVRLNVAKRVYAGKDGQCEVKHFLYSVNDIKE